MAEYPISSKNLGGVQNGNITDPGSLQEWLRKSLLSLLLQPYLRVKKASKEGRNIISKKQENYLLLFALINQNIAEKII
jgi:hypothetical protein